MIVLLNVRQPQERSIPRLELVELPAHRVVRRVASIELRLTTKSIEPGCLAFRSPPSIGHEVTRDPEHVATQFLVVQPLNVRAQQTTECVLHDVVGVAAAASRAIDVRPQWARRALVEPRELKLVQRSTYTERAISFEAGLCDCPLINPIRRDSLSDT